MKFRRRKKQKYPLLSAVDVGGLGVGGPPPLEVVAENLLEALDAVEGAGGGEPPKKL